MLDVYKRQYHYCVSEVNGGEEGVVYDSTVYNIAVTLTDNGDGTLTANAAVEGAGTTANSVSLSFANAAQGSLSVSKIAEGNGADTNQQFSFTLQLANTASRCV